MNEPATVPPVLVTCLRCGREASDWIAVLWQREHDRDGDVEVIQAEALAILCLICADVVHDAVRTAVDIATM
ncbi:MAG TPA: hypothetical protein VHH34_12910 [Pseudonocardiaceae bacterium]|nr:hypothetical protein [Pseudonocardiaceae bacterium]